MDETSGDGIVYDLEKYRKPQSEDALPVLRDILTDTIPEGVIRDAIEKAVSALKDNPTLTPEKQVIQLLQWLGVVNPQEDLMSAVGELRKDISTERVQRFIAIHASVRYASETLQHWTDDGPSVLREKMNRLNLMIAIHPELMQSALLQAADMLIEEAPGSQAAITIRRMILLTLLDSSDDEYS